MLNYYIPYIIHTNIVVAQSNETIWFYLAELQTLFIIEKKVLCCSVNLA